MKAEGLLYCDKAAGGLASGPMKNEDPAVLAHQEQVAARLKNTISALGLTAKQAAGEMGVSPQRLNGWLNGGHPPPMYHLMKFCRLHPVTLDYLVMGDPRGLSYEMAGRLKLVSGDI